MRSTARVAFQRHIEECEYDAQELARLEAEEAARLAEIEAQAAELRAVATLILGYFEMSCHVATFLASADGLAILANCCNAAAKWHDDTLYEHKPTLINLVTENHPECWQSGGVVYIETVVGQVSFHALYGEDQGLPEASGRVWSELEYQMNADIVALAFVEGWSKDVLQRTISEKSAACEELVA